MALLTSDRVLETSSNTGTTATFNLAGPPTGYFSFVDKIGASNTCYYAIINTATNTISNEWEIGLGTVGGTTGSGNGTITRTSVLSSSNTNSLVNFSAGTKQVFITYPATKAMYSDANGGITINNINSLAANTSCYPTTKPSLILDFINNETLDPRISFSRASNTTANITGSATYYDRNTEVISDQNLLRWSNDITNANVWVDLGIYAAIRYTAQTAPDGSNTANKLFLSATTFGSAFVAQQNYSIYNPNWIDGNVYTYSASVWLKTDGPVSGNIVLTFSTVNQTTNITNVWTKYTINNSGTGSNDLIFGFQSIYTDISMFWFWAPQIQQGATASLPYTPTYANPITIRMPVLMTASENTPRFDHDPVTRKPLGLLIEESRTNLLTYSGDISNAIWTIAAGMTKTTYVGILPNGLQGNILRLTIPANLTNFFAIYNISATAQVASQDITGSIWMKLVSGNNKVGLSVQSSSKGPQTGNNYVSKIQTIDTIWNRYFVTGNVSAPAGNYALVIGNDGRIPSQQNMSAVTVDICFGQLEIGSFATSYINTTGTPLTRNADTANISKDRFLSWFNGGEGSIYSEFMMPYLNGNQSNVYEISDSVSSYTRICFAAMTSGFQNGYYFIQNNGFSTVVITTGETLTLQNNINKSVIVYKDNSFDLNYVALNSNIINSDFSQYNQPKVPQTLNQIQLGANSSNPSSIAVLNGYLRKFYYYPKALSRDTSIGLTR